MFIGVDAKQGSSSIRAARHMSLLERFHKCCSHRPVAGPPRRSFFTPGRRPTGPWLQLWLHRLQLYLTRSRELFEIFKYICYKCFASTVLFFRLIKFYAEHYMLLLFLFL